MAKGEAEAKVGTVLLRACEESSEMFVFIRIVGRNTFIFRTYSYIFMLDECWMKCYDALWTHESLSLRRTVIVSQAP